MAEIFVRVNSGGVELKQNDFILTLLSLYWDEGRRQIETFSINSTKPPVAGKTTSYNLVTPVYAQDLIRVVMAYPSDTSAATDPAVCSEPVCLSDQRCGLPSDELSSWP